jgi:hypothetical protein
MKQDIPWNRYTAESIVIVASILLAFAIDAWWEERGERAAEQILLENLLSDFKETEEILEVELPRYAQQKEWALSVLEYGISGGSIPKPEILHQPFSFIRLWMGIISTYPKTDTLDGALASGRIGIISNHELRSSLAGWPRIVKEFSEQDAWIVDLVKESRPVIATRIPIASTILSWSRLNPEFSADQREGLTDQITEFIQTETAQNYMALKAEASAAAEMDGELLLSAVNGIIHLLEQELM